MNKKNGFTIVELAIVLLVVALLLGGLMIGLSGQIEQRRVSDTQKGLDEIKEALIGYAVQNGRLPCPDLIAGAGANDGVEDVAVGGTCTSPEGNLPWVTLGIGDLDAWQHRFHYRVTPAYSNRAPQPLFNLASAGVLIVCPKLTIPPPVPAPVCITTLPAVILSYGKNGKGAITSSGAQIPLPSPCPAPPATNKDECENTNLDNIFVSRPPTSAGGTDGEFDDQVTWITSSVLNSRMISAQKLP